MTQLKVGQIIGPWTLREYLGSGGNSEVWLSDDATREGIALKVLTNRSRYGRFRDEIEFLRSDNAKEPGILPLIDSYAPDQLSPRERAWLAMPRATPIRLALGEDAPLEAVVSAIADVALTLARLAENGVTHRDLKPENLFRLDQTWVVGDFGLVDFPEKEARTKTTERMGPVFYIAPELLNDPDRSDTRPADVYSLAKTLWVLGSGLRFPLQGTHDLNVPGLLLSTYSTHARAYLLDRLIEACTRYAPESRPPMRELARELQAWIAVARPDPVENEMDDLRRKLEALSESARRREQIQAALVTRANEALEAVRTKYLDDVAKQWKVNQYSNSVDIFKRWGIGKADAVHMQAATVTLQGGYPQATFLHAMAGVALSTEGQLTIAAAYGLVSPSSGPDVIWQAVGEGVPGGPATEALIDEIGQGLRENLSTALSRFVGDLELQEQAARATTPEVGDTQPPRLLAFVVEPGEVDCRDADQVIEVTVRIADDLSGVAGDGYTSSHSQVRFRIPNREQFVTAMFGPHLNLVDGTAREGSYRDRLRIPRYSEPGFWPVEYFLLVDQVGNMRRLTVEELSAAKFPTGFRVTKG